MTPVGNIIYGICDNFKDKSQKENRWIIALILRWA